MTTTRQRPTPPGDPPQPGADIESAATGMSAIVPEADIAHRYSITSSARRTVKPSEPSQLGLIVPI